MKKIILFLALPIFLLNLSAMTLIFPAQAQSPTDINSQQGFGNSGAIANAFGQSGEPTDIRTIVANIIVAILGLLGTIFIVLILYAGFKYMTSMGNEEQTSEARGQIVSAVIGLAIILAAYAITSFVTSCLIGATSTYIWTTSICGPH
ncbi:MAG: pilin [Patescibacteria group bacterium]|nr:pilin [Patescibacteria group bacterium]